MKSDKNEILGFIIKSMVAHTITYFVFGFLASTLFDYNEIWQLPIMDEVYRDIDSQIVAIGPMLQPLRGLIYAIVLLPFRKTILEMKNGWLTIWGLFIGLAILGTFAAAPLSIEGIIYTNYSAKIHLIGIPEIFGQSLCYSIIWFFWARKSEKKGIIYRIFISTLLAISAFILYIVLATVLSAITGNKTDPSTVSPIVYLGLLLLTISTFVISLIFLKKYRKEKFNFRKVFLIFALIFAVSLTSTTLIAKSFESVIIQPIISLIVALFLTWIMKLIVKEIK